MIKDKYYKPVEKNLFEQQFGDRELASMGRTEEFPSEMAKRHAKELEMLRTSRVTLNHIQWFQLYPYSRTEEQQRTGPVQPSDLTEREHLAIQEAGGIEHYYLDLMGRASEDEVADFKFRSGLEER